MKIQTNILCWNLVLWLQILNATNNSWTYRVSNFLACQVLWPVASVISLVFPSNYNICFANFKFLFHLYLILFYHIMLLIVSFYCYYQSFDAVKQILLAYPNGYGVSCPFWPGQNLACVRWSSIHGRTSDILQKPLMPPHLSLSSIPNNSRKALESSGLVAPA